MPNDIDHIFEGKEMFGCSFDADSVDGAIVVISREDSRLKSAHIIKLKILLEVSAVDIVWPPSAEIDVIAFSLSCQLQNHL